MTGKNIVRLSWFVVLLLLTSAVTIPAYSQTYDKWFEEGWNSGCEDKKKGALNNTEGRNTPFAKGYNLGFAECLTGNTVNDTAVTQTTNGNKTDSTPTESAYDIGCGDVGLYEHEKYINQPGNEPSSQTEEFMNEYYRGYYECGGDVSPTERGFESYETNRTHPSESTSLESLYSLGYTRGCEDAGLPESERFASMSHRKDMEEWVRGYNEGFSSCGGGLILLPSSPPSDTQSPTNTQQPPMQRAQPPSTQPPMQGGIDWITVCSNLQSALVSSCNVLVNPDNTLTAEGERAVGCIRNGIALAGGGTLLASLPLPLVITALKILEEPTGCGGIVKWDAIGNVGDLKGIINLLT